MSVTVGVSVAVSVLEPRFPWRILEARGRLALLENRMDVMELPQRMEQFSRAYVHAIAAVAGANVLQWSVDDDSIDVGFGVKSKRRARLEAQLKCT